ncbi:C-type lectin domain family 12 member B-like [Coregonus clupeaformis]|uniref:C-type lectin domain family 12 member B-like n=1 Tax=Coregonus clupeaformis TaxID=59861 RepID=UPI001E1C56E0|nr:C-type lectin domain family 12 member B-like [Coregonus clupeaformis]
MAEELHYSTVVFKNPIVSSLKKKKEEETVYAEVKAKGSAVTQQSPAMTVDEMPALHSQPFRGVAVCLGVVCVLLLSAIIGLCVYFSTAFSEHNTKLVRELEQLTDARTFLLAANQVLTNLNSNLSIANHILQSDYSNVSTANQRLVAEKEEVSRERDRLNWTLRVIYQFEDFPVNQYCSPKDGAGERKCNPCRRGWMLFQSSCYQILYPPAPWNTWEQSRMDCKQNNADLVVIGSQKEQEFIHNHTQYYYDKDHGYWIGLNDIAKVGQWLWVSGSHQNLTDGFWKRQTGGDCVLTVPNNAPLDNWNAESCSMQNRWICESRALILSDEIAGTLS